MYRALPHQEQLHGIILHYMGEPTTAGWYTEPFKMTR